ncbi:MAG: response regulator transcription factor [Deltaproteobacteria bacterium]|nr:MAG: response regulator transcription factor [Deltaproteobacteria bacterium]
MDARILLVEDDPSIREVTAIGLGAAGFEITTAVDGVDALERFRAEPYDLILLDVMLPRLDGYEVARQVRRTSTVPIVMLTARADTMDVVVGLEAGADDYELRLGNLVIDVGGRTVTRDGTDIPLTRTEFDLLIELIRHAGQVLSRDVLLDRVWGYDYLGDSRLVDVAIQRLRSKVETDPATPELIQTVRGSGYKAVR